MYEQVAKIVFNIYQKIGSIWNHKDIFDYVGYNDTLKGLVYLGFDKKINNDNFVEGIMLWLHSLNMRKMV